MTWRDVSKRGSSGAITSMTTIRPPGATTRAHSDKARGTLDQWCRISRYDETERVALEGQQFRRAEACVDHLIESPRRGDLSDHLQHLRRWVVSRDPLRPALGKREAHVPRTAAEIQSSFGAQLGRHDFEPLQVGARGMYRARQVVGRLGAKLADTDSLLIHR